MTYTVLGLGSNKAFDGKTPLELLVCACKSLSRVLSDIEFSSVYKTAPMYFAEQDEFFNMAVCGFYKKDAFSLLDEIHSVEEEFGRNRSLEIRNGPRPLDIDIELFGKERISTKSLIIPHERLTERAFVLAPLLELLPENADETIGTFSFYDKKLKEALASDGQKIQKYLDKDDFFDLAAQN